MTPIVITADNLPRVVACEGSMNADRPDINRAVEVDNQAAREGTAAHVVVAVVLRGQITHAHEWVGRQMPNGVFITPDMADAAQYCVDAVSARVVGIQGVEIPTDFGIATTRTPFEIHGRADWIGYDPWSQTLHIDDFKFGWRLVEVEEHWTLIAHAIGWTIRNANIPIRQVEFTIHQPNPYHPLGKSRTWTISADQLAEYLQSLRLFFENLSGRLTSGPHCRNCPARAVCPAAFEAALAAVDVSRELELNQDIPDDDLARALDVFERAEEHIKTMRAALVELAMFRVNDGHVVGDYVVELQRGNRRWKTPLTPGMLSMLSGVPADTLTEPATVVSPAQAQKRGVPETVVNAWADRPITGKKLVKRDIDKLASKLLT